MILKSRHCITTVLRLCYRNPNIQAKNPNLFSSFIINEPSFKLTRDYSCRDYSTFESKKLRIRDDDTTGTVDPVIRGKAATALQVTYINDLIVDNDEISDEQWSDLLDRLSKVNTGLINSSNTDGRIIETCYTFNKLNIARSYLKYMKKVGKKFNVATVTGFIKVCYDNRFNLTSEDLARVEQFTKYLITRYTLFDPSVGEAVVKGLCLKNDWQKCISIVDQMRKYIQPNYSTVSAYLINLIENDQIENAIEELERALNAKASLTSEVYTAWLNKMKSNPEKVERLLLSFRKYDVIPKQTVTDFLISIYSQFPPEKRLTGTYTMIQNTGFCENCGEKLQRLSISDEEFNLLRDEFLNRVLINSDVFKNTTPEELESFFKIVEKKAPFDVVIDGLNVIYMTGTFKNQRVYAKLLTDTVRYFVERDQKVLVIGRKHMYSYAKELLDYVRKNSTLFLINDSSEDDPYMIYATFYSGPDACFVTRDLMRSEKFRLSNDKLAVSFKRWQLSHQIFISYVSHSTGRIYLKNPIMFEMAAQPSKHGWHIPYNLESYAGEDQYGLHEHWLCLKK